MSELTREEKLNLINKLPQRLQDFLYSEDTGAFLLYIANKYKLPDKKVSTLSKIIVDIVLKITPLTSLAQEIVGKITPDDHQTAMAISQELNNELLIPVLMPMPAPATTTQPAPVPAVSATPIMPVAPPKPVPEPVAIPKITPPNPPLSRGGEEGVVSSMPVIDRYREPTSTAPEIIDLRKTPPPPMPAPVAAAPIPPSIKPPAPLTFTKPIEPIKKPEPPVPLIEAEPHKTPPEEKPQFIIRSPGLPPTDK